MRSVLPQGLGQDKVGHKSPEPLRNRSLVQSPKQGRHQEMIVSFLAIICALTFGTVGYMIIEGWSVFDAFYMTVITLATIGYGETHPLSFFGRVFTITLIFLGVGLVTVVIASLWRSVLEVQISKVFDRRRKVKEIIDSCSGHTIFCGFSRLGRLAAEELRKCGTQVVIAEINETRADEAEGHGFLVVRGDATVDETLITAGVKRAARIVTLLPRDAENLYVILTSREVNPKLFIVSRAEDDVGEKRLIRAGADTIISAYRVAARKLADGLLRPYVTDFFEIAGSGGSNGWKMEEIRIPAGSAVCGKSLKDLSLRQSANVSIAAVISPDGKLEVNPSGDTVLSSGTTVIALGSRADIVTLEEMFTKI